MSELPEKLDGEEAPSACEQHSEQDIPTLSDCKCSDNESSESKISDSESSERKGSDEEGKVKKKAKKKKPKFVDDGRTVYSMEGLGRHKTDKESLDLSKKERRALIKAAFAHYLPILFGVIGCFAIAALIMYLWLH